MRLPVPSFLLALAVAAPAQQTVQDFGFLSGAWAHRKDGFSFTTFVEPILGGSGYRAVQVLDDTNRVVQESIYQFDAQDKTWSKTSFHTAGHRSTFVGTAPLQMEMYSFVRRPMDPVRSRLVFTVPGPNRFVMDWQTRKDASSEWQPRPTPFVHDRVKRTPAPTGRGRIAFISNRGGNWEIYTMAPDGSDVVNVSRHEAGEHRPVWLAGGTRLGFLSQRGEGGSWQRWEANLDGSAATAVAIPQDIGVPEAGPFPRIHPGGSYIVYAAEKDGELDLYRCRFDGGGKVPFVPAKGADRRPQWSPDGEAVLFESERDGNPEIYVVGADGKGLRRLTENAGNDRYAAWSPCGKWIVFASDRDTEGKSLELYVMARDGANVRRLTDNDAEDGEPSWSPDSRSIVFRSNASGNAEICVIDVASREITNISRDGDAYDGEPVWSPAPAYPLGFVKGRWPRTSRRTR